RRPGAGGRAHADVHRQPRRAGVSGAAALRPGAVSRRRGRGAAGLGLSAVRRRHPQVHRRRLCDARGGARAGRVGAALPAAAGARARRRAAGAGVAAAPRRPVDASGGEGGGMSTRSDGPGIREALWGWAAWAVVAGTVFITYARLPARDFYNVTGTGIWSGAARLL